MNRELATKAHALRAALTSLVYLNDQVSNTCFVYGFLHIAKKIANRTHWRWEVMVLLSFIVVINNVVEIVEKTK